MNKPVNIFKGVTHTEVMLELDDRGYILDYTPTSFGGFPTGDFGPKFELTSFVHKSDYTLYGKIGVFKVKNYETSIRKYRNTINTLPQ